MSLVSGSKYGVLSSMYYLNLWVYWSIHIPQAFYSLQYHPIPQAFYSLQYHPHTTSILLFAISSTSHKHFTLCNIIHIPQAFYSLQYHPHTTSILLFAIWADNQDWMNKTISDTENLITYANFILSSALDSK